MGGKWRSKELRNDYREYDKKYYSDPINRERDRISTRLADSKRKNEIKRIVQTPHYRFMDYKNRCTKTNSKWSWKKKWLLTEEQYVELLKQGCHYCGTQLIFGTHGVGLDRIDNSKDYSIDNVLPCCKSCNLIRGIQLTVKETEVVIKALLKFRNKNYE